jgi:hypothetical protein
MPAACTRAEHAAKRLAYWLQWKIRLETLVWLRVA